MRKAFIFGKVMALVAMLLMGVGVKVSLVLALIMVPTAVLAMLLQWPPQEGIKTKIAIAASYAVVVALIVTRSKAPIMSLGLFELIYGVVMWAMTRPTTPPTDPQ